MPKINKTIDYKANENYMNYERAVRVKTQKTFTITLSDNSYEYLNTYGFMPTRQQQSDMVQKLLMKPKAPIEY